MSLLWKREMVTTPPPLPCTNQLFTQGLQVKYGRTLKRNILHSDFHLIWKPCFLFIYLSQSEWDPATSVFGSHKCFIFGILTWSWHSNSVCTAQILPAENCKKKMVEGINYVLISLSKVKHLYSLQHVMFRPKAFLLTFHAFLGGINARRRSCP